MEVEEDTFVEGGAWDVEQELDDGDRSCEGCPREVGQEVKVALPVGSLDRRVPEPSLVNSGTAWGLTLTMRGARGATQKM